MARPLPKRVDENGWRIGFLMLPDDLANRRDVSSTEKIVWAWIRAHEPREGAGGVTASTREIARGVGVHLKTAWLATMALRKRRLLRVEAAGRLAESGLPGKPAVWTTLLPDTSVGILTTPPDETARSQKGNAGVVKMPTQRSQKGNAGVVKMTTGKNTERECMRKGKAKAKPSPPLSPRGERQTAKANQGHEGDGGDGLVAGLATKAQVGGGKWPFEQWAGQTEEDFAAKRYTRSELAAFVAGRTAVTEAPWRLAESVRRHADAAKAAAFRERIRTIRAGGLMEVRCKGDPRRWCVQHADEAAPVIILETMLADPEPTTLEDLERSMESNRRLDPAGRGSTARSFLRRIEALRAGLPDPNPPPAPSPERREIRSLVDLAGWHFSARAGGRPSARTCEDSPAATASPAPALCLCLCDPT